MTVSHVQCVIFLFIIVTLTYHVSGKGVTPLRKRVLGESHPAEPTWFCIQRLKAGKTWKTVSSPGYPKSLNMKHSRCTWKITAPGRQHIRIAFRAIDLYAEDTDHCSSNYLEIIDEVLGKSQGRLCGRKTSGDIVSQGNKLRMDLQRDPSEKYQRGFSFSFMATKAKSGFYSKKTFSEKPLPPMRRPKDPDEKESKPDKKETNKKSASKSAAKPSGHMMITADGQLVDSASIQDHPIKRQINNDGSNSQFRRISNSEGATSGMPTLTIIGIVVGGLIGLLIIFLILRKLIQNKKNNDENKEGEVVQSNSGLPKINMTHDNVVSAKRNILAPTVVVGHTRVMSPAMHSHPGPPDYPDSDSKNSDSPPDYRKLSVNENMNSRTVSKVHKAHQQHRNGVTNEAYFDEPNTEMHLKSAPSRTRNERRSSGKKVARQNSPTRKVPYRYNSKRSQGLDQKKAIEALNNEQFCEYDNMYNMTSQQQRQPKMISTQETRVFDRHGNEMPRFKTRQPVTRQRTGSGSDGSIESDDSDVFLPKSPKYKNKPNHGFNDDRGFADRNMDSRTRNKVKSGRSRTFDAETRHFSPKENVGSTKRNTIEGTTHGLSGRESRKDDRMRNSGKKRGYNDKNESHGHNRNRFIEEKQSPNLPRHIVPSSRR